MGFPEANLAEESTKLMCAGRKAEAELGALVAREGLVNSKAANDPGTARWTNSLDQFKAFCTVLDRFPGA